LCQQKIGKAWQGENLLQKGGRITSPFKKSGGGPCWFWGEVGMFISKRRENRLCASDESEASQERLRRVTREEVIQMAEGRASKVGKAGLTERGPRRKGRP